MSFRPTALLRIAALLLLGVPATASAQLSLSADYEIGQLLSTDHTPNVVNRFRTGTAIGGVGQEQSVRLRIQAAVWSPLSFLSLNAGAGVQYSFGAFVSDQFGTTAQQFVLTTSVTSLDLSLGAKARIGDFSVAFDTWLGVPLSQSSVETYRTSGRSDSSPPGNILLTSLPYGLSAELQWNGISEHFAPAIFTRLNLAAAAANVLNPATIGLSLTYEFGTSELLTVPPLRDTAITAPMPQPTPPPQLAPPVIMSVLFLDRENRLDANQPITVGTIDTLIREYVMLPHSVSNLDSYRLLSHADASAFTIDSLAALSDAQIKSHFFNIIGLRLRESSRSTLTFHYSSPGDLDHAKRLIAYLKDTWDIEPSRLKLLKVITTGLSLSSQPASILAPAAVQWVERRFDLSNKSIDIVIQGHPVTASMKVSQKNQVLLQTEHLSDHVTIPLGKVNASAFFHELMVSVTTTDSSGRVTYRLDTLHLAVPMNSAQRNIPSVQRFVIDSEPQSEKFRSQLIAKIIATSGGAAERTIQTNNFATFNHELHLDKTWRLLPFSVDPRLSNTESIVTLRFDSQR